LSSPINFVIIIAIFYATSAESIYDKLVVFINFSLSRFWTK